jgi:hypothetical protein
VGSQPTSLRVAAFGRGLIAAEQRAEHAQLRRVDGRGGQSGLLRDGLGDIPHRHALLPDGVQHGAGRRLLQRDAEEPAGVADVYRGPAVPSVADVSRDPELPVESDEHRDQAVAVVLPVHGPWHAHEPRPDTSLR